GVRRGLIRLAAEIVLDGLDQGHQLALIVAALGQFVRDNDLGACVGGGLCVIGLNEAILRLHDAAFRIGEVALRLGIGLVRRWCRRFARLLAAFGLALLFFFGLDATLFLRLQLGLGLQRRHRSRGGIVLRMITKELRSINLVENSGDRYAGEFPREL